MLSLRPTLHHRDAAIYITVNMDEAPVCVGWDRICGRQVGDVPIGRNG